MCSCTSSHVVWYICKLIATVSDVVIIVEVLCIVHVQSTCTSDSTL